MLENILNSWVYLFDSVVSTSFFLWSVGVLVFTLLCVLFWYFLDRLIYA